MSAWLSIPVRILRWLARGDVTRRTVAFDLTFGVVLPIAGIALDRTVVAHSPDYDTVSGAIWITPYVQLFTLTGIAGLLLWHLFRKRVGWWAIPASGLLGLGAAWATFVACFAVPMSGAAALWQLGNPVCLILALGLLTPLTAWAYLRNTARAIVAGEARANVESRIAIFALVGLLLLAGNFVAGRLAKAIAWRAQEVVLANRDSGEVLLTQRRLRTLWVFPGVRPWRVERAAVGDESVPVKPHARQAFEAICSVDCDEVEERRRYDSF